MPNQAQRPGDNDSPLLVGALQIAERGMHVFPCHESGERRKAPRTAHGFKDATTDPEIIRRWWQQWPRASIGVATGKISGVVVLDIDNKPDQGKDGEESLFALLQDRAPLPDTPQALTPSGGRHIYFTHPVGDLKVKTTESQIGPGLDIRGDGGYAIAPPSEGYEWEASSPPDIAAMPSWLIEATTTRATGSNTAIQSQIAAQLPPARIAEIQSALDALPTETCEQYDLWLRVGMGLHHETGGDSEGFRLWDTWSRKADRYPGEGARQTTADKWASFGNRHPDEGAPITITYLFKQAHDAGWNWKNGPSQSGQLVGSAPTEDELALSFTGDHPDLRFVYEWGKWLHYDRGRWAKDTTLFAYDLIRGHNRRKSQGIHDEKLRATVMSAKTVAAVERLARADRRYAATVAQWDSDDWLLNTPGGVIDLKAGSVIAHRRDLYQTKQIAVSPAGACPMWLEFLETVMAGDTDLIGFLQRTAGYCLTGSIREHALLFFYGTGRNGKGVFLNTLTGILADYAAVASMDVFTESHGDRHPTDLAMLQSARLVVAQETEAGKRWAESRIKTMTGGDPITARFMRQDFFTFEPKFKLIIAGNHKPVLHNVDEAMRRRLHLVPFAVTITKDQCDPDLQEKLKDEWPGILQWAIDGCATYLREGLNPPEAVSAATGEYFDAQDVFSQWIADCCETGANLWQPSGQLFASWKQYAEQANEYVGTTKTFKDRMESWGFIRARSSGQRLYRGLQLLPDHHGDNEHFRDTF